jgi:hypothetical protein
MALIALPLTLLGAAAPQTVRPDNAAIIYNPGNGDFSGFRIVVGRNGEAWATDAAGNESGHLSPSLTQAFFADLAAVPLAQQPARACPSSDPNVAGTSIWLNAGSNPSASTQSIPNPDCALDPSVTRLFDDALAIEHALYVSAYRTRTPNGSTSNVAAGMTPAYSSTSNSTAAAATSYATAGNVTAGGTMGSRAASTYGAGTFASQGYSGVSTAAFGGAHANTTYFSLSGGSSPSDFTTSTNSGMSGLSAYGNSPDATAPAGLVGGTYTNFKFGNAGQFTNPNLAGSFSNSDFRTSMGVNQGGLNSSAFKSPDFRNSFGVNGGLNNSGLSSGNTSFGGLSGTISSSQLGR